MTDAEILELATKTLLYHYRPYQDPYWYGDEERLLKFAREIRAQSFREWYGLSIGDDK